MSKTIKPVPEGFHTLTPALTVRDAAKAIEFYKKAFNAVELMRLPGPDGKIMHASLQIGDSRLMLGPEPPESMKHPARAPQTLKAATSGLYLYVTDADALFAQALKAGAKVIMPLIDQFWGDRAGQVQDPEGHLWWLATHKEDLTPEETAKRRGEAFSAAAK